MPPGFERVDGLQLRLYWDKLEEALQALHRPGGIALAYSGGLDSRVLVQMCMNVGLEIEALHCAGPQYASAHSTEAVAWLEKNNVPYRVVEYNTLGIPEVRHSDPKRCYYCKKNALGRLKEIAGNRVLCDGTNFSDLREYRPGLAALRELNVCSPFASVRLAKVHIRRMAEIMQMEIPQKNYQNCLLTRFQYGLTVREAQLETIEQVELALRPLLTPYNMRGEAQQPLAYRLRYLAAPASEHGCRPELHIKTAYPLPDELYDAMRRLLAKHGMADIEIRAMDEISGYFDRNIFA